MLGVIIATNLVNIERDPYDIGKESKAREEQGEGIKLYIHKEGHALFATETSSVQYPFV